MLGISSMLECMDIGVSINMVYSAFTKSRIIFFIYHVCFSSYRLNKLCCRSDTNRPLANLTQQEAEGGAVGVDGIIKTIHIILMRC